MIVRRLSNQLSNYLEAKMSNKVPKIRFNGYSDAWVQRNLGEVVQKVKSYSLSRDVETEDDTGFEYIHYGDIHTQKADVIDGNTKLPSIVPGDYDLIQEGDVIVADASEDYLGIAEPAVVVNKPTENLVAGLHTIAIRPNGIHPLFLYYLLHTQLFKHFGYRTGTGLKVFGISYPNLAKFTFAMPTLDEQEAIANTLRDMDNLIAANQRKLDLLKEQKKGYLQKMFPKNGAKVPELRFAGFADDWEERKFGELLKEFSIKSKIEDEYNVLSSTNSGMEFREGRVSGTSNLGYKIIKNGDLVLSPQNLWLGNININNIGKGLVSPSYKTFEFRNIDSSFINPQLRTQKMLEEYKNSSTQGASVVRRNLEIDSFYQIKIFVPTITEQEKIGSFFKQLDNTIALHQRKLDLLKEQKKGYLQKMFAK